MTELEIILRRNNSLLSVTVQNKDIHNQEEVRHLSFIKE